MTRRIRAGHRSVGAVLATGTAPHNPGGDRAPPSSRSNDERTRRVAAVVLATSTIIALVGARPYTGSWNDASRLAAAESLVDRGTFVIDDSIFVRVPGDSSPRRGTQDKLFIDGHFYSDKPPVSLLPLAGWYWVLQAATGLSASVHPGRFCYWLTVLTSGVAYVVAVWCVYQLGAVLRLAQPVQLLLTASFALSTVALPYSRHVNAHELLLAVAAALYLSLARLETADQSGGERRASHWLLLGLLAGAAYGIDLGAGPPLLLCTVVFVAVRWRSARALVLVALGALPLVAVHHALNAAIAGTLWPANAVPEYLLWPGSPFTNASMTGRWHHTAAGAARHALGLLVSKQGFLLHNLPLCLALAGTMALVRQPPREWQLAAHGAAWSGLTWVTYSLGSNNYGGACASVRWFVPLLVPAYLTLVLVLREHPARGAELAVLTAWGAVLAGVMWWYGPWMGHMIPLFWPLVAAALISWLVCRRARSRAFAAR